MPSDRTATGPLAGVRVLEFEGIGPGPFCGMLLADMGADVLLVDRAEDAGLGVPRERRHDVMLRGRRSLTLDLKSATGAQAARLLACKADALIEGFRPGVMERLGLGPDDLLPLNPSLVYGRMTGWGQTGPLAPRAGHDINYIALTGLLNAIGRAGGPPVPPLNLVGDFGGGGALLAFGIVCGLLEARGSGRGQVIDAAMIDGASLLGTMFAGMLSAGTWSEARGANLLDTGAPWYDTYETSDGRYVAVGALEPKFYAEMLATLGLAEAELPPRDDVARWPELRSRLAAAFRTRSRDEWAAIFADGDACVAPVLSFSEAPQHPHALDRQIHAEVGRVTQPMPAPRFSRTPGAVRGAPPERGAGGAAALADWGFSRSEIAELSACGVGLAGAAGAAPDS